LYITSGKNEISLEELNDITGYITTRTGEDANVIWGDGVDENLDDEISITLIATGFNKPVITVHPLNETRNTLYAPQTVKTQLITEVQLVPEPQPSTQKSSEEPERIIIPEPTINNGVPLTLFADNSAEKTEKGTETTFRNSEPIEVKSFFRQEPEFEIVNPGIKPENKAPFYQNVPAEKPSLEQEDQRLDRISKLKNLSHKTYGASNVEEMERVPAYLRRNVDLPEASHLNEGQVSRYTLGNDAHNKTGLRENNSFLHDNVD
jgi:cell division protein FtsZ